jgi:hypothetical protein
MHNEPFTSLTCLPEPGPARRRRGWESEMKRLSSQCSDMYPPGLWCDDIRSGLTMSTVPLQEHIAGDLKSALLVLTGAVGLVLLIIAISRSPTSAPWTSAWH